MIFFFFWEEANPKASRAGQGELSVSQRTVLRGDLCANIIACQQNNIVYFEREFIRNAVFQIIYGSL